MTTWQIYLLTVADGLDSVFCIFATVFSFGSILGLIGYVISKDEDESVCSKFARILKLCVPVALIFMPLSIITPNSKELAAIYLIPRISQNQDVHEIAGNGLDIAKELTKKYLKELTEEKE